MLKILTTAATAAMLALTLAAAPAKAETHEEAFKCKWRVLAGPWVEHEDISAARIRARKQALGELSGKSAGSGAFASREREFVAKRDMRVQTRLKASGAWAAVAHLDIYVCNEGYKASLT